MSGQAFNDVSGPLSGSYDCIPAWVDYDVDGDLDLACLGDTTSSDGVGMVAGNDRGFFRKTNPGLAGIRYSSLACGDYDNDGDLDLVIVGSSTAQDQDLLCYYLCL